MGHVYIENRIRGKKKFLLTRYFAIGTGMMQKISMLDVIRLISETDYADESRHR